MMDVTLKDAEIFGLVLSGELPQTKLQKVDLLVAGGVATIVLLLRKVPKGYSCSHGAKFWFTHN